MITIKLSILTQIQLRCDSNIAESICIPVVMDDMKNMRLFENNIPVKKMLEG